MIQAGIQATTAADMRLGVPCHIGITCIFNMYVSEYMYMAAFDSENLDVNGQTRSEIRAVLHPSLKTGCYLERDVQARVLELEPLQKVAQYNLVLEDSCNARDEVSWEPDQSYRWWDVPSRYPTQLRGPSLNASVLDHPEHSTSLGGSSVSQRSGRNASASFHTESMRWIAMHGMTTTCNTIT